MRTTGDPLAVRARSTPDRTAVLDAETGESWRYDALNEDVSALAARLAGLGLGPGDRLGLIARTSVDAVRAVHAAWRRGLRLVPLDVRLAADELVGRVERCDLDGVACTTETATLAAPVADCPVVSVGGGDPSPEAVRPLASVAPATMAPATWRSDDPALALFTSGTTGVPKAVELCLPIYHMGGLAPVFRTTVYGTALVVQASPDGFEADAVAAAAVDHDVTGLSLVPTQLRRILEAGAEGDDRPGLADSVRTVLLGGAPASRVLIDRCEREGVPVHPTYGLTETASQVATARPEQAFEHPGTVGQPLVGTSVTVVDDDLSPLPAGETGEIVVAGPTVTPGYVDDPAANRTAFCEHGLRTGDVGRLDEDGRLWVTGRLDDRIVTGGENVQPARVVDALTDHPAVADAAVVGLADPEWGERVAALVVVDADGRPGLAVDDLREHCRGRLADYAVPKTIRFADSLPRTASGTVEREAVRRVLAE